MFLQVIDFTRVDIFRDPGQNDNMMMKGNEMSYEEIQEAMLACEAAGDVEGAELYQSMLDELGGL